MTPNVSKSGKLVPPNVEVIIPCHSSSRPLERAVRSVLQGNQGSVGVTVVAHNIAATELSKNWPEELRAAVNWLECNDGVHSPAGPFMKGLESSQSKWVVRLDSDDYLQAGTIRNWLALSKGFDAVIARLLFDNGRAVRTPPVRPFFHRSRNAVKDRLYYRSAPLGLLRREFLVANNLGLDLGLRTGEDLRMSALLWTDGRIEVQRGGAAYVVGTNSKDRVTEVDAPLADDLRHVEAAWQEGWASKLPARYRTALATKYLRIHFFGAAYYRALHSSWSADDRETLAAGIEVILRAAPKAAAPLSVADRRLLTALTDLGAANDAVNRLALERRKFGKPSTLFPANAEYFLHREAPLRFMAASAAVR